MRKQKCSYKKKKKTTHGYFSSTFQQISVRLEGHVTFFLQQLLTIRIQIKMIISYLHLQIPKSSTEQRL